MTEDWLQPGYEQGLVSVIIPCHNQERYLQDCLKSVTGQEYHSLEVIIVNDGSTDGTTQIMEEFRSAQREGMVVRCFYQSKQGAPRARNKGCRNACGEFIQFLDGDDVLCHGKIAEQVTVLKNDNEVDVVYGDGQYLIDGFGFTARKGKNISMGPSSDIIESMLFGAWAPSFSYLVRRSAVQRCGPWDITLQVDQDFEYFLRMAIQRCRFSYLAGVNGLYRKHSFDSISEQSVSLRGRTRQRILAQAESWLRDQNEFTKNRRYAMAENYRRIARSVYSANIECFRSALDCVLKICPHYRPRSRRARLISSIIGFRNYEKVAALINRLRCGARADWY